MYDNNLDAILSSFYLLNKKNEKINYYYEPRFTKKNKNWKRSYVIDELKKDFKKDIMNYGFSPFIENNYNEQKKDKNIMKYFYVEHYNFSDYIKKMNYLIHHKQKENNNDASNSKDKINLSFQFKSIKTKKFLPNILVPKTTHNLSLSNIYKDKDKSPSNKKTLSKTVKFNRENLEEQQKILNKKKLNNVELDSSFNYENESSKKNIEENDILEKENKYLNKKILKAKLKLNKSNSNKSFIQNNKLKFIDKKVKILKINIGKKNDNNNKFLKENRNTSAKKIYRMNQLYNPLYNNRKTFSRGKSKDENRYLNDKKFRNKNLFLEKLENYSKSIFKTAKKIK